MGFPGDSNGKESAWDAGEAGLILGWEDPMEEDMATPSSILAWRIPWTEEPGGLQSMGQKEWDTTEATHTHMHRHYYLQKNSVWIFLCMCSDLSSLGNHLVNLP